MHEGWQSSLVDYQSNFSHSVETIPAVLMGMLRISRRRIPRVLQLA
jgi:hypothetical protein